MYQRRQILVLENEKLLAAAVCSLLAAWPNFDVTVVTCNGLTSLEEQLDHTVPDVIIVDEETVATQITAVMQVVDRYPKLRLIVLGLGDNHLHVFDKRIVQIREVNDFIAQL